MKRQNKTREETKGGWGNYRRNPTSAQKHISEHGEQGKIYAYFGRLMVASFLPKIVFSLQI